MHRPRPLLVASLMLVVSLLAGCTDDDSGEDAGDAAAATPEDTTTTTAPVVVFTPITGGTDEDGDPEPPPVHAAVSVVVRGDTTWAPYAGRELTGLDAEAATAVAGRIRQIDEALNLAGVDASFELTYGNAAALCEGDPGIFDELDLHGHEISIHARTNGETFRAMRALASCGVTTTTASGLPAIADPVGPTATSVESLIDAMGVLSIQDVDTVVGTLSPMCESLGLSAPTNNYGTGAYTAPWRSAWVAGQPCADDPARPIVMIDEFPLAPDDDDRIDASSFAAARTRMNQTLGWAADLRYRSAEELPAPGMLTWGLTMRLDDLIAPPVDPEDADEDTSSTTAETVPPDPRTAPLGQETLDQLVAWFAEWQPEVDNGRLIWLTPTEIAAILRPT